MEETNIPNGVNPPIPPAPPISSTPATPPIVSETDRWRLAVAGLAVCALVACALVLALPGWLSQTALHTFFAQFSMPASWRWHSSPEPVVELPPEPVLPQPVLVTTSTFSAETMSAASWLVRDVTTGKILLAQNANTVRPLASLSKLLSALVILDAQPDWATTTVAVGGWAEDPFILTGAEYRLKDLWNAALVASSNRSIISLAQTVTASTTEFAQLMNSKAAALGMHNTTVVEPSGLSPRNVSTAADVALLVAEAAKHPEISAATRLAEFTIAPADRATRTAGIHMWNTDWLITGWVPHKFADIQVGKTGFIPEAGYNFAMQVANDEGYALNVVSLGAENNEARFYDARHLAGWVFDNYTWK